MNKMIMIAACVIGCFFGLRAWGLCAQAKQQTCAIKKLDAGIARMKAAVDQIAGLADGPIAPLTENLRHVYEAMDIVSHYRNLTSVVHIHGADDQGAVLPAFQSSAWPGIMKADVDIQFNGLMGVDQYMAVLDFMRQLEEENSLRIMGMGYKEKGMVFNLEVYGRSST